MADFAVSDVHGPTYLQAAQEPLGCAGVREASKEARHGEDVRRAGNTFVPVVWETHGALGGRGQAWFKTMVDARELVGEDGDPLLGDAMVWARAAYSHRWQQLFAVALQRGNARVIIDRARASRDRLGTRVRIPRQSDLDDGEGGGF